MTVNFLGAIDISGGAEGSLDAIDGSELSDTDGGFAISAGDLEAGFYTLDADSAESQVIPAIMTPDTNAGDKRWKLTKLLSIGNKLYEPGTTNEFEIIGSNSGDWLMDNKTDGGLVQIQGESSGNKTLLYLNPAGQARLYFAGTKKLNTLTNGVAITGNTVVSDTVESANVTASANVSAVDITASNSITLNSNAVVDILDEDDLTSDSATALATQQSIRAYVDNDRPYRNIIINGDMTIAQYGDQTTVTGTDNYACDRFEYLESSSAEISLSQSNAVPNYATAGAILTHSLEVDVTTADAALTAGQFCVIQYQGEGYDLRPWIGRPLTLSYWVKAWRAGKHSFAIKLTDQPAGYCYEYTINASDTWQYVEHSFTIPGTYTDMILDNTVGWRIYFPLATGTDYEAPSLETWYDSTSATYISSADTVNRVASTSDTLYITGVRLEPGLVATPYAPRLYSEELALCQRYYVRNTDGRIGTGVGLSTSTVRSTYFLPVQMRTTPTYSVTGTARISLNAGYTMAFSAGYGTGQVSQLHWNTPSGFTPVVGQAYVMDFGGAGTDYIEFKAEL